ncbi:uncharacterized protein LOC128196281 [Vigna angularis]|uniref:uncharacterized protein LOC128196281 n=1 Tax=Phaseolus angularis TaxID=3914 RepID=UPI0022B3F4B1|nr:uncharacterized protein LOC128196281 [Vigna angularis]
MMNMDDVVIHVKGVLERANSAITKKCCIYRVPLLIRQLNQKAYTPKVVSIGPYHHNTHRLRNMERHKVMYCKSFLQRTNTNMETWIKYIAGYIRDGIGLAVVAGASMASRAGETVQRKKGKNSLSIVLDKIFVST